MFKYTLGTILQKFPKNLTFLSRNRFVISLHYYFAYVLLFRHPAPFLQDYEFRGRLFVLLMTTIGLLMVASAKLLRPQKIEEDHRERQDCRKMNFWMYISAFFIFLGGLFLFDSFNLATLCVGVWLSFSQVLFWILLISMWVETK